MKINTMLTGITLGAGAATADTAAAAEIAGRIMACEQAQARLVMLDAAADWSAASAVVWEWSANQAPEIAPEQRRWFGHPSDAKPVRDGSHVLATFSGEGVALIRMADKKVIFHASAGGNPHSADLLPDGNIITASSHGSYLRIFRTDPAAGKFAEHASFVQIPMLDAHGVLWDERRQRVWAVGGKQLKRFQYDSAKLMLTEEAAFDLPGGERARYAGGHDLSFTATGDRFFVTTMRNVYVFDSKVETFSEYGPIGDVSGVKSVSEQSAGGPVLLMRASESWWSDTLRFAGDERMKRLPGARFYKARWWPEQK